MGRLIVYGNCQSAALYEVLRRIPAVTQRWEVVHHQLWAKEDVLAGNLAEFDDCEVLLQQDLRDWRTHPRAATLAAHTKVVRFPFCYFAALWPFDGHQNGNDPSWNFGEGELKFGFTDSLLGKLRALEPDPVIRAARYRALDVADPVDIARYAAFEAARLLRDDQRLGFTLGRFILDNFRSQPMFHAITHPSRALLVRMTEEILPRLGIDAGPIDTLVLDYLDYFQVPLHPKVIAALGIAWADDTTTYKFNRTETLTFDAYVARYIRVYG